MSEDPHKTNAAPAGHGEGHDQGHDQVRQMADQPDTRRILAVGLVGIAVTIVSIFFSYAFQRHAEAEIGPGAPTPTAVAGTYQAEGNAGILERDLYLERKGEVPVGPAQTLKRDQSAQLSTYGWVDRNRGIIRIPIDQAMDQVVQAYGQRR